MAKTTKSKAAKAKGRTPAKKSTKATKAAVKASAKATTAAKAKGTPRKRTPITLSDEFMKTHAYQGTRDVPRMVDKVAPRETENVEPVKLLERIGKMLQKKHGKGKDGKYKFRFSTAHNVRGTIFRYRHADVPEREVLLRTYDNELYTGKIGCGRPVFNGSPTKTGDVPLKKQKLGGLIPQKNKPDKYWWFDANTKNEKAILKFMSEIGW
jgi:hypothetical protein